MRRVLPCLAVAALLGCDEGERPRAADAAAGADAGLAETAASPGAPGLPTQPGNLEHVGLSSSAAALEQATLDVLFVIDNSGSMASEQGKLASEIPRMVAVLTSGDRYATRESEVPPGLSEKARRFTPVRSLHLGLVTTNFGGLERANLPANAQPALTSCAANGDSGKLQNSLQIAREGVTALSRNEFLGFGAGATVLAPDPSCALDAQPLYQTFEPGVDPSAATLAFSCVARVGVRGCPFEQPLESMWNALAPAAGKGDLYAFLNGARGNGDRENAGFVRPGAALAVVVMTDEDDCSITEAGKDLFSLTQDADDLYGNLNLRCSMHGDDTRLVRPTARYHEGLSALKGGNTDRLVFTLIAGAPLDARTRSIDALLQDPALVPVEDVEQPGLLKSVCTSSTGDEAYAGRRLLQAASAFPNALVESICSDSYAPVIDAMVEAIAPMMGP